MFSTPATSYVLADGKSDVEVPFTWTDGAVKVVKTFGNKHTHAILS